MRNSNGSLTIFVEIQSITFVMIKAELLKVIHARCGLMPASIHVFEVLFEQLKKPTVTIILAVILKSAILIPKNSMCPILPPKKIT